MVLPWQPRFSGGVTQMDSLEEVPAYHFDEAVPQLPEYLLNNRTKYPSVTMMGTTV